LPATLAGKQPVTHRSFLLWQRRSERRSLMLRVDTRRVRSFGHHLSRHRFGIVPGDPRIGGGDQSHGERIMNLMYWLNGLLALLLFGYLLWALIKAERF
jgi:K+-transporting ATPase KdpF subunit